MVGKGGGRGQGRVSGAIHVRDLIAQKRGGGESPCIPIFDAPWSGLTRTTEPIGPVIRSYRGSYLKANSVVNWFVALSSHSGRRSFSAQRPPFRLQPTRRAAAGGTSFHREHRALHRRRHLRAEAIGAYG
jgi:hypothetical protein